MFWAVSIVVVTPVCACWLKTFRTCGEAKTSIEPNGRKERFRERSVLQTSSVLKASRAVK